MIKLLKTHRSIKVNDALKTIDEYNSRFNKLRDGQKRWVEDHGTIVHNYCPICKGKCEFSNGKPSEPRRMAHTELSVSRKNLVDNAYYFLIRCHKIGLLNLSELETKCDLIGTSIEPADLK